MLMPFVKGLVSTDCVAASVGSETAFNLLLTKVLWRTLATTTVTCDIKKKNAWSPVTTTAKRFKLAPRFRREPWPRGEALLTHLHVPPGGHSFIWSTSKRVCTAQRDMVCRVLRLKQGKQFHYKLASWTVCQSGPEASNRVWALAVRGLHVRQ